MLAWLEYFIRNFFVSSMSKLSTIWSICETKDREMTIDYLVYSKNKCKECKMRSLSLSLSWLTSLHCRAFSSIFCCVCSSLDCLARTASLRSLFCDWRSDKIPCKRSFSFSLYGAVCASTSSSGLPEGRLSWKCHKVLYFIGIIFLGFKEMFKTKTVQSTSHQMR